MFPRGGPEEFYHDGFHDLETFDEAPSGKYMRERLGGVKVTSMHAIMKFFYILQALASSSGPPRGNIG